MQVNFFRDNDPRILTDNYIFSVSLDPDEDIVDPQQFVGLLNFLDNDLTCEERGIFFNKTLPCMINRALKIKELRPKNGLHFSLQQQRKCQSNSVPLLILNTLSKLVNILLLQKYFPTRS